MARPWMSCFTDDCAWREDEVGSGLLQRLKVHRRNHSTGDDRDVVAAGGVKLLAKRRDQG